MSPIESHPLRHSKTLFRWWHYTFGQQTKQKFARSHTHIFYFVNDQKNFTFNDFAIRTPSDRQLIYNDSRANPSGKMPDDVWLEYPRVCGTFKEREGWHPCQMPEKLLIRIISVSSNPGDCVLDPFCGSGTTAAAACLLDRNYVGIEISKKYVKMANERLEGLKKQQSQGNLFNIREVTEIKQLLSDIQIPAQKIAEDKKLLRIFKKQLSIRLNNGNNIGEEKLASVLMDLAKYKCQ